MGISYAYWNDSLEINTRITTGNIGVSFGNYNYIESVNGTNELTVNYNDGFTVMNINGNVSHDFEGFLQYFILDHGSLPVVFKDQRSKVDSIPVQNMHHEDMLYLKNEYFDETGNPVLYIFPKHPGIYEFEIEMLFEQRIK